MFKYSVEDAYDIDMIVWKFYQNQKSSYLIGFFHKIVAPAPITYVNSVFFNVYILQGTRSGTHSLFGNKAVMDFHKSN